MWIILPKKPPAGAAQRHSSGIGVVIALFLALLSGLLVFLAWRARESILDRYRDIAFDVPQEFARDFEIGLTVGPILLLAAFLWVIALGTFLAVRGWRAQWPFLAGFGVLWAAAALGIRELTGWS
jgi:hypothetical protein